MESEVSSSAMQRLLGVNKVALNDLAKRNIVVRGERKGTYAVEASVGGYCHHLRDMAAGRGGEDASVARARLGQAQVDLAEAKAAQIRGETVPVAEVETFWRTKPRRSATACLPSRHASKTYRLGRA